MDRRLTLRNRPGHPDLLGEAVYHGRTAGFRDVVDRIGSVETP